MGAQETNNYQQVLRTVRRWSAERRFALVQDVIDTLATEIGPARAPRETLDRALGLLATDQPPPSDEDVERWLQERRMERYG
jgi:hypothetical protein